MPVLQRFTTWWLRNLKVYGNRWRLANGLLAALVLLVAAIPAIEIIMTSQAYALSVATRQLVGSANTTLASQLTYSATQETYEFNQSTTLDSSANSPTNLLNKLGAIGTNSANKSTYALSIPQTFSKGVTYTDSNSGLSFTLTPQFSGLDGKQVDNHLVFPLSSGMQAIYTLKNNGLKEDIVVPQVTQDKLSFTYTVTLPNTLSMKIIPGSDGAIGVYSADPALYGNVQYGSSSDQAAVEKAREQSPKDYLVFGLPAPVVKNLQGDVVGDSHFVLNGNTLTIEVDHLNSTHGPITIDPSVVVTSTSDFQTGGNNEGDIDFSSAGQITRAGLTGATVSGGWTTSSSMTTVRDTFGSVAYNGYLYSGGGEDNNSNLLSSVEYAPLNATTGAIGTWAATTSLPTAVMGNSFVAYNGYLYSVGGKNAQGSSNSVVTVVYAPINSNGSLGSWTATSSLVTASDTGSATASNGYIYQLGGWNDGTAQTTVQYAPLNANGTVGTWQTTTSTPDDTLWSSVIYNGYIYTLGMNSLEVYYAPLAANGTVGTWQSFSTPQYGMMTVYDGYLYIINGNTGGGTAPLSAVYYTPLYANGGTGTWTATASTNVTREDQGVAAYNGYLYNTGGYNNSATIASTEYAKIDPAGRPAGFKTSGTFTTTRRGAATVAWQGRLFVFGGDAGSTPNNSIYGADINNDGSLGTWSSWGTFTTASTFMSVAFYDQYVYILGGCSSAYSSCSTASNDLTTVTRCTYNWSSNSINSCSAQTGFTTGRYGAQVTIYKNYIYVMGGMNGSTYLNDVQYHALDTSTGAISGAWTTASSSYNLPTARAFFGLTQGNNGTLYVAGGKASTGNLADVQYAKLNPYNGGFATGWTSTNAFTNARYAFGLTFSQGYLYLAGGYNGTTYYADTQYAPVNTDGSIGSWSSGPSMASGRMGVTLASTYGTLYIAGGYNGTTYYNSVQWSPINNGGNNALSNTTATSNTYPGGVAAGYGACLYSVGISDATSGSPTNAVLYATINADGTVGNWTATTSLQTPRNAAFVIAANGYLYALSGSGFSSELASGEYAPINANCTLGAWQYTTATFSGSVSARSFGATAAYGGYLYMLGGYSSEVDYAKPASNGDLLSINVATAMPFSKQNWGDSFTATAYNGYLYIGGNNNSTPLDRLVEYVKINSDGSLGAWLDASQAEYLSPDYASLVAYDGFMYDLNDESVAPIAADGSLGRWDNIETPGDGMGGDYGYAYKGYLFGITSQVESMTPQIMPRVAAYSHLTDLGSAVNVTGVSYNGTLPAASSVSVRTAGTNGILGATTSPSAITSLGQCASTNPNTRYVWLSATLDDTSTAVFPDSASTPANLTDFTVTYQSAHPAPATRLRGGQTLQQGSSLSPLDTCIP